MHDIAEALVIDMPGDFPVAFAGEKVDTRQETEFAVCFHVVLGAEWWGGGVETAAFDRELAGYGAPPREFDAIRAVAFRVIFGDDDLSIGRKVHVQDAVPLVKAA